MQAARVIAVQFVNRRIIHDGAMMGKRVIAARPVRRLIHGRTKVVNIAARAFAEHDRIRGAIFNLRYLDARIGFGEILRVVVMDAGYGNEHTQGPVTAPPPLFVQVIDRPITVSVDIGGTTDGRIVVTPADNSLSGGWAQ